MNNDNDIKLNTNNIVRDIEEPILSNSNKILNILNMCERKHEQHYSNNKYICEYYNTISNLIFIILGIIRLCQTNVQNFNEIFNLYLLFILAGICSGFHHMFNFKWTIIIDWIPITLSIIYLLVNHQLISLINYASWFKLILAFSILFIDNMTRLIHVPWGHVFWHILAGLSIDSVYNDILIYH
jgi:hypothetical protein